MTFIINTEMNPKGPFLWVLSHCNAKWYPTNIHTNSFLCPKMSLFNCPLPFPHLWVTHELPSTGSWAEILESSHAEACGILLNQDWTGVLGIARWTLQYRATREGHVVCAFNQHRRTYRDAHSIMVILKLQNSLVLQTKRKRFQIKNWEWLRNSGLTQLWDKTILRKNEWDNYFKSFHFKISIIHCNGKYNII